TAPPANAGQLKTEQEACGPSTLRSSVEFRNNLELTGRRTDLILPARSIARGVNPICSEAARNYPPLRRRRTRRVPLKPGPPVSTEGDWGPVAERAAPTRA